MIYRIKDWDEHFENAASRRVEHCSWAPIPNKQDGLGYSILVKGRGGAARYGAWCAIILLASKQKSPRNGWLTHNGKPDGRALGPYEISLKTKMPENIIEETLKMLCNPEVDWMGAESPLSPTVPLEQSERSGLQNHSSTHIREGKEQKGTEGNIKSVPKSKTTSGPRPYTKRIQSYFSALDEEILKVWAEAYPNVDIEREIRRSKAWLLSNPRNAKKDFQKFVNNWLSRQMERGKSSGSGSSIDEMPDHIIAGSEEARRWMELHGFGDASKI